MATFQAKVVFLGAQGVGKTSFINRYVGQMFSQHTSPTIGASFFSCNIILEEYKVKLLIWDTAGQERFRAMAPMYYRNADAAIVMFDITCRDSFNDMKTWAEELRIKVDEPIVMCIVANKSDKSVLRKVDLKESLGYATSIGALFHETSAMNSEGVEAVFMDIAQELVKHNLRNSSKSNESSIPRIFSKGNFVLSDEFEKDETREKSFICC